MNKRLPHRFETFGIQAWRGQSPPMKRIHSHTEIELNLVEQGELHYVFGSEPRTFKAGHFYIFNGVIPHRLVDSSEDSCFSWLTIPAHHFTQWDLPNSLVHNVLTQNLILDTNPDSFNEDVTRFARWRDDLDRKDPRLLRVIMLEVRARLERLALDTQAGNQGEQVVWTTPISLMIACILRNLTNPDLTLGDIADSADLNPSYASTLFSKKVGQSPIAFLTEQRLSYAALMLATTQAAVLEVAFSSGFGSASQFYTSFKAHYGTTPTAFRTTP